MRDAPPDDVTIAWLLGSLHKRSFGLVMLLIALVGLVPGVSVFTVLRAKKRGPSPKISRETLAEMVGTTRSRVSFFMNKFHGSSQLIVKRGSARLGAACPRPRSQSIRSVSYSAQTPDGKRRKLIAIETRTGFAIWDQRTTEPQLIDLRL